MDAHEAQAEVDRACTKGALAKRLRFSLTTPRPIKRLLAAALQHDHPYLAGREIDEHHDALKATFARMSDRARRRLTKTLLPRVVDAADAAWAAMVRRPWQSGPQRKPFRCPHAAGQLAVLRGGWLLQVAVALGDFDRDVVWVAGHGAHLAGMRHATDLGWLLAGALETGGREADDVLDVLAATASGEHPTGQMGRHVTQAMMSSSREDAWQLNERLLLAAQRQEGLRQAILEAVDESHPEAFRRMLRLIRAENLARFSSVVRAFDTWFGFMWDGSSGMKVAQVLDIVLQHFDEPARRDAALRGSDPEAAYLALWTLAFDDVATAVPAAVRLLDHDAVEIRFVATHLLAQLDWSAAVAPLAKQLDDDDLRVAARALACFQTDVSRWVPPAELQGRLERLMARLAKRTQKLPALVWPWWSIELDKAAVARAMRANGKSLPAARLLPFTKELDPWGREQHIRELADLPLRWSAEPGSSPRPLTGEVLDMVLDALGDPSPQVRDAAFDALARTPVESAELDRLVHLLGRKPGDLRNRCLQRLRTLSDDAQLAAASRLLADDEVARRLAGLELLRAMVEADRAPVHAREIAQQHRQRHDTPSEEERAHLDVILGQRAAPVAQRDDALGLIDPRRLRAWDAPRKCAVQLDSEAAARCVDSLAQQILAHRDFEIDAASGGRFLLIDTTWAMPHPTTPEHAAKVESGLPLGDLWRTWLHGRGEALRDADGLELLRAWIAPADGPCWEGTHARQLTETGKWSSGVLLLQKVLLWGLHWQPPNDPFSLLLDALETDLAALTSADVREMRADRGHARHTWGLQKRPYEPRLRPCERGLQHVRTLARLLPGRFAPEHATRLYGLLRWFHRHCHGFGALVIQLDDFVGAYRAGAFGDHGTDELIDLLVGRGGEQRTSRLLEAVSTFEPPAQLAPHAELLRVVERCRERIVEVETQRGDRITAASSAALRLQWTGGLSTLTRAMQALGRSKLARGGSSTERSRQDVLSHLVLRSRPQRDDTPQALAAWAEQAHVATPRLVELAAYAPQWAGHVEVVLRWAGLASAVWWLHAHTKDTRWSVRDLQQEWAAQVSEQTPLSAQDLLEGAVDVAWFHDAYGKLGAEHWQVLDRAAKYASGSGGHKRAQLFAAAMTGATSREELLQRIDDKRHQDAVRALGLVPLASGAARQPDLLARYQRLQEFARESKRFGSQRQQSEGRAVAIALDNLARTAGYRDPLRLQWAMEREAVADLAEGAVTVVRDEVTLRLSIDDGEPALSMQRKGRTLKSIPAALRKDAEVAALQQRAKELRKQAPRLQQALETAMCRGDGFERDELIELLRHPILAPALARLVFVGDGLAGYPVEGGRALRDHAGALEPIGRHDALRIAHPHDLLARGDWAQWQRECFASERVQPFKQVFRELYPITATERHDKTFSRRYAGHQVNPRQALALLGGRGWVTQPDEGVSRTDHHEGLTARLAFENPFHTPAEIEGLTLDRLLFTEKGKWEAIDLAAVPPRLFSETMRDLDLVVSVAHQGGVDPEASASTIEMRAALLRECQTLLGLDNVEVKEHNAIVRGELAEYSVHLGSAQARLLGGPALWIVAVHGQHRGRLFLPFADDDPRTAEVLSKVLLLARDRAIQDPHLLEQIRASHG